MVYDVMRRWHAVVLNDSVNGVFVPLGVAPSALSRSCRLIIGDIAVNNIRGEISHYILHASAICGLRVYTKNPLYTLQQRFILYATIERSNDTIGKARLP